MVKLGAPLGTLGAIRVSVLLKRQSLYCCPRSANKSAAPWSDRSCIACYKRYALNAPIFPRQSLDEKKASSCHNVGYRHISGALVGDTLLSA